MQQPNVKSQIVFAMESTAHYWLALYARLLKDGYTVLVLNPIQSHSLRELYIRKTKTDAKDALIVAGLVRVSGAAMPAACPGQAAGCGTGSVCEAIRRVQELPEPHIQTRLPVFRRAIWLASTAAVQCDPMFRTCYEKKTSEGLCCMNTIGYVSRKMTAVIFAMLRDGQPYRPVLPNTE